MKLSVITINLDDGPGLEKTLLSVINQTQPIDELIVIDGGSIDTSVNILEKYSNDITYWISEKDKGIYNAMNKGVAQAKGDYCYFLNSGDVFYNNQVINELNQIQFHADLIAFHCIVNQADKQQIINAPKSVNFYDFYIHTIIHQAVFIRRNLFEKIGNYNENYKIVSDWDFLCRALFLNNCSFQSVSEIISIFDTTGISSKPESSSIAQLERSQTLNKYFSRYIDDYSLFYNKAIYNFLNQLKHRRRLKRIFLNIIKVLNKILG